MNNENGEGARKERIRRTKKWSSRRKKSTCRRKMRRKKGPIESHGRPRCDRPGTTTV